MPTPFDLLSRSSTTRRIPTISFAWRWARTKARTSPAGPKLRLTARLRLAKAAWTVAKRHAATRRRLAQRARAAGGARQMVPKSKPHIRLKNTSRPPKVKKIKPQIKLKASAYGAN